MKQNSELTQYMNRAIENWRPAFEEEPLKIRRETAFILRLRGQACAGP